MSHNVPEQPRNQQGSSLSVNIIVRFTSLLLKTLTKEEPASKSTPLDAMMRRTVDHGGGSIILRVGFPGSSTVDCTYDIDK